MTPEVLRVRTRQFALEAIRLWKALPKTDEAGVMGRQLLRSATSVGANCRSVCLARSKADFVSRMSIVLEEADETAFWLELLEESGTIAHGTARGLRREASELARIFGASLRTAKGALKPLPPPSAGPG